MHVASADAHAGKRFMPLRATAAPRVGIKPSATSENPSEGIKPLAVREDERQALHHLCSGVGNARRNAASRGDQPPQAMFERSRASRPEQSSEHHRPGVNMPRGTAVDQGSRPRRSQTKPDSSRPPSATNESGTSQKASNFAGKELFGSVTQNE